MNCKKAKITLVTTDEFGVETVQIKDLEVEGTINLLWEHERPIVPSSTFLGQEATFTTTGFESFKLELVSKTAPKKV